MPCKLENENEVLASVRRFLHSGLRGQASAKSLDCLVSMTSRISLANLDAWERKIRTELCIAEELSTDGFKFWKKPSRFASLLDLCSGDGFRREKILCTLPDGVPNSFFFSLAMRRLNDWVPQVRAAARENLLRIASPSKPILVVDTLWHTLPHCPSWRRIEDADWEVLQHLISLEGVVLGLKRRIIEATAGPATSVLTQAGRSAALDQWLGEIASHAIQPSVRAKAYRCQLESRMTWLAGQKWVWTDLKWCKGRHEAILGERILVESYPFLDTLKAAVVDRSSMVRRVAGELLIRNLGKIGKDSVSLARALSADSCQSVAERGRFALTNLSENT